jgi:uncharacterized protein (DUF2267 family)
MGKEIRSTRSYLPVLDSRKVVSMAAIDHVEVFDATLEKTYLWLNELAEELGTGDRRQAYQVLRAFLHALRDRLPVETAAKLGAQLPMLVRGFYYEGWDPTHKPEKMHLEGFLDHIRRGANLDPDQVEMAVRAASKTLQRHVTSGELAKSLGILPNDIFRLLAS